MNNHFNLKKNISLDSVVLFILVLTVTYFLVENLNVAVSLIFWLPTFLILFIYLFLDLISQNKKRIYIYKLCLLSFLIIWLIGFFSFNQVHLRYITKDINTVHDGVIQVEEGIKCLLQGRNPYKENYFGTPLEKMWNGNILIINGVMQNPALYHFIHLPFKVLFSIPFYIISINLIGWYDQTCIYILFFFLSLLVLYKIPKKHSNKLLCLIIFAFNPLFIPQFIQGTDDIFIFFWIILSIYLLRQNKINWSSLFLAFAVMSKHSAWFLVPFYFIYLFLKQKEISLINKWKLILKQTLPFWIVIIILFGIFLIWDFNAFIEDIYKYPAGTITTNYPIRGRGFSVALLLLTDLIKSHRDYFPFWIIQSVLCIPLFYFLIKIQIKNNTLSQIMFNYGLLLFVFWVFSRFFHDNYISYLSMIFISAYFLDTD